MPLEDNDPHFFYLATTHHPHEKYTPPLLPQVVSSLEELQELARDIAVKDARRLSDRTLPLPSDVESAVIVPGDGNEPPEWWSAFESGYT